MNKIKKKELIEKIAHILDITPDMYNHSESVVQGIAAYLKNINPNIKIYKQGSFKIGTVVRPYKKDRESDFDVDLVIEFSNEKKSVNPRYIKISLRKYLEGQNYEQFLDEEGRRCWTLNYPHKYDDKTISFHIDLLPCVRESEGTKRNIKPDIYINSAIAITHITDKRTNPYTYEWMPSNPLGYAKWFDDINYSKYAGIKGIDRQRVFENNRDLFGSLDKVDEVYTRSPLQRVIQILKRHKDVMYANTDCEQYKPISIIITTLVGRIVEENNIVENDTYELLNIVLKGLEYYASLQTQGITSDFAEEYKTKKLIQKRIVEGKAKWFIKNPANSGENLANKWCQNPSYSSEFFKWVKQVQNDLADILEGGFKPDEIISKLKFCLGEDVANELDGFDFSELPRTKQVFTDPILPKPYKAKDERL